MQNPELEKVLHTTGYLPPRNEEEMIAFEKVYSGVKVDKYNNARAVKIKQCMTQHYD